jgi:hypothetical protein
VSRPLRGRHVNRRISKLTQRGQLTERLDQGCRERTRTGFDRDAGHVPGRLLATLRRRRETVWAIVARERIVVRVGCPDSRGHRSTHIAHSWIHLPEGFRAWWAQHRVECWSTLEQAAATCWRWQEQQAARDIDVDWIFEIPGEPADVVARNTYHSRPRPSGRAVTDVEREAGAGLMAPAAKLYDALEAAGWIFLPQPPGLAGKAMDRRADYLIFWRGRDQDALLVEVDNDGFHASSRREDKGAKERLFETHGFHYLRFSDKRVLGNPGAVAREITRARTTRHGK